MNGRLGAAGTRLPHRPRARKSARENRSKHEQETAPHALSGIQGQGGTGCRSRRQDAGRTFTQRFPALEAVVQGSGRGTAVGHPTSLQLHPFMQRELAP